MNGITNWRWIFLLLIGMAVSKASAQEPFQPELAIGFQGGYQFSRIAFDPAVPQNLHQGYTGGIVLQYLSQPQLGIQLEINYSQRGWSAPEFGEPVIFSRDLTYLEIPFLTHFAFGKKSFRVVVNAGSYLAFLLQDDHRYFGGELQSYFLDPIGRKWAFGLAGGFGFALRSRIGVFQLEAKGGLGFSDIFSDADTQFITSPMQSFGGQFSYLYRLNKR